MSTKRSALGKGLSALLENANTDITSKNKLEAEGKVVAFSGDTAPCEAMVRLAKDADLLIHECTFPESFLAHRAKSGVGTYSHTSPLELGKIATRARRVAGLCTGAFVLADAGLLDGRRATTHWYWAEVLQQRHPLAHVEADRIYIADGPVWTSAGMTAELDLALALVEKDLGAETARSVARRLVMHQRRSGGQSQHSEMLELAPKSDRIQQALEHARRNLSQALSVEELAEVASLSPRQFSRVFTAETGQSPAKAVEGLRLEAARLMIESSRHPLDVVARETGFRDRRHMREAFMRGFGIPPQAVRREARIAS